MNQSIVNPKTDATSRTLNVEGTTGVIMIRRAPLEPEALGFHSADLGRFQPYNTLDTLTTIIHTKLLRY
jgi:hypothetical protein